MRLRVLEIDRHALRLQARDWALAGGSNGWLSASPLLNGETGLSGFRGRS